MKYMQKREGFSAVEILVFIIIIAIIAAIAVPKLLESKRLADEAKLIQARSKADEASAVLTLRAISRANMNFHLTSNGRYGNLSELNRAGLLDATFSGEGFTKNGYSFSESVTASGERFCASAVPVGKAGENRSFAVDEKGSIYAGSDGGNNSPSCADGGLTTNGASPLE